MSFEEGSSHLNSSRDLSQSGDTLVLDLETKHSFAEVGGRHNLAALGVSMVGVYHYADDRFVGYRETDFSKLEVALQAADKVIGFNLVGFDWPVLAACLGDWVLSLPTIDLMLEAQKVLGHRVSLNSFAEATLGATKLGSGLDALTYYAEGDWVSLERYCLEDVKLTRDLYEYAKTHGQLYFMQGNYRKPVAMTFQENPYSKIFQAAAKRRSSVRMVYNSSNKARVIDVYSFDGVYIKGHCHNRKKLLTFRLDRVESAEAIASSDSLF